MSSPDPAGDGVPQKVRFDPFLLDLETQQLLHGDTPVKLRPRTWKVLCYLATRHGQLVTKNELIDSVWSGIAISEVTLSTSISELRAALGDSARSPRFVETIHGRGFRFIAELGALRRDASPPPTRPLVGRALELATIDEWFCSATSGQRRVGFVHGEAGIGKSELVRSAIDAAESHTEFMLGIGHCVDRLCEGEAFGPILQLLGHLAEGPGRERLTAALTSCAPSWLLQVPRLVIDIPADQRLQLERDAQGKNPARAVRELAEAFETLAGDATLVLWLEDIHWADRGTWDVLEALARRTAPAHLLVIASHRPPESHIRGQQLRDGKPELVVGESGRDLALPLLGESDLRAYLDERCPGLPNDIVSPLHRHTGGNALFVTCVVDALISSKHFVREEGDGTRWELKELDPSQGLEVPSELRELMHLHFDALDASQQALIEAASVVGTDFCSRSVAAALGTDVDLVEKDCEELVLHHSILRRGTPQTWPDGETCAAYSFSHALRGSAAYARITVTKRARYHRAIAEHLVQGYGEQSNQVDTEIAHHFLRAHEPDSSLVYLCKAAEAAVRLGAWNQAERQVEEASELLADLPTGDATLRLEAGLQQVNAALTFVRRGLGDEANFVAFDRMREIGEQLQDPQLIIRGLDGVSGYYLGRAEYEKMLTCADRMVALGEQHDVAMYRVRGLAKRACVHFYQGRFAECVADTLELLPLYVAADFYSEDMEAGTNPATFAGSFGAIALLKLGRVQESVELANTVLRDARTLAVPYNESLALLFHSWCHWYGGDWEAALAAAEESLSIAATHGFELQKFVCDSYVALGRAETGLPPLPASAEPAEVDENIQNGASGMLWQVGREHLLRGRPKDALATAKTALALASKNHEAYMDPDILALQAGAKLALGSPREEAEAHYQHALELCRERGIPWVELRVLVDRAEQTELDGPSLRRLRELAEQFDDFNSPLQQRAYELSRVEDLDRMR